jgi:hypothetical protein
MLYEIRLSEHQAIDITVEYLEECFYLNDAPKKEIATILEYIWLESEFEEWKNEVIKYLGSFIL